MLVKMRQKNTKLPMFMVCLMLVQKNKKFDNINKMSDAESSVVDIADQIVNPTWTVLNN